MIKNTMILFLYNLLFCINLLLFADIWIDGFLHLHPVSQTRAGGTVWS